MNGERFGRGDAAVYPHVAGSAFFGYPLPEDLPRLGSWAARCGERPSVQRESSELAEWIRLNLGSEPSSSRAPMPIVRQYRDHRLEWMMKSGGADIVLKGLENGTIRFAAEHR
jgi:glutathione S-transferase/RNA polymerase-associated protein